MDNSQYKLCLEVLSRLESANVLKDTVLVGSWCTLFYKDYFGGKYSAVIATRDMDLLIPCPKTIEANTDVAELLKDLGFIVGFTGSKGYIRLEHPELIIEFLVPEIGRPMNRPYKLPQLHLNAQPLRYLELLSANTIKCKINSTTITLPHPANFALQKLLILPNRKNPAKRQKDKDAAINVLNALLKNTQKQTILQQTKIKKQLQDITEKHILDIFTD